MSEVPCIRLANLTETQKKAYILADNRLAEIGGGWDQEMLKLELADLAALDVDLGSIGFGADDLNELKIEMDGTEGQTDPDEVPEPPAEPKSERGKIYQCGKHRVMCGDSTSGDVALLMDGKKADMMFTDPPYGVNYEGGHFHSGDVKTVRKREKLSADASTDIYSDFLPMALPLVDGPCYLWFADSKARDIYNCLHSNGCEIHALIIWHKTNATYAAMNAQYKQRHEPCLYFKPNGSTLRWCGATTEATVWNQDRDAINDLHPTQKPVALSEKAISNHDCKMVLDPFGGSGSTMIGCEKTGREGRICEISPAYVDVIRKRWAEFVHGKDCDWQALTPEVTK
jgi:DNA modification methylase